MGITIESNSLVFISVLVFLISLVFVIFKGNYTWRGLILYVFVFWAYVQLFNIAIVPLNLSTNIRLDRTANLWIPFYSMSKSILDFGGNGLDIILFFGKHLLFAIPCAMGTLLLRTQKVRNPKLPIVVNIIILILGLLSSVCSYSSYVFDTGAFFCLFIGTIIGFQLGKWIEKQKIFLVLKEDVEDDFS